ncbi:MAG: hypothetical protein ABJA57_04515 [Ginsengibacter sp.]
MLKFWAASLVILMFFFACEQKLRERSNDPLESGRQFIDASLKGNYEEAKKYILPDSVNLEYFNGLVKFNERLNEHEKEGYKNANIIINSAENISDSVTIINYSNTFKNEPAKIKLVKINHEWMVDFKYTFSNT